MCVLFYPTAANTNHEDGTMNNITEMDIRITVEAAVSAIELMAKKAGVSKGEILEAVLLGQDDESNTFKYFESLVTYAQREVPKMI